MKPAALFPREAFEPANLLLACAPCRERKRAVLTRAAGALSGVDGPIAPVWPHLYWRGLASPSRLPFRHRLYESGGGGAADRRPLSAERLRRWVGAYRQGRIELDWGPDRSPRLAFREPRARSFRTVYLAAVVEAGGGLPGGAAAARATIDMLDLNGLAGNPRDHRAERRARAWLAALDFWQQMDELGRSATADAAARAATEELRDRSIEATGFWGVWLEVFRDTPGFQQRLAGLLPGTALTSVMGGVRDAARHPTAQGKAGIWKPARGQAREGKGSAAGVGRPLLPDLREFRSAMRPISAAASPSTNMATRTFRPARRTIRASRKSTRPARFAVTSVLAGWIGIGGVNFLEGGRRPDRLGGTQNRLVAELSLAGGVLLLTGALSITPPTDEQRGIVIRPIPTMCSAPSRRT